MAHFLYLADIHIMGVKKESHVRARLKSFVEAATARVMAWFPTGWKTEAGELRVTPLARRIITSRCVLCVCVCG